MNRGEHIKADILFLGYTDESIHRFIDDFSGLKHYGPGHRIIRHNYDYLMLIRETLGKKAFYIALLHILIDFDILMDRKELKKLINL